MRGERLSGIDRFLRLFTEVRAGEGRNALLLLAGVFVLLASYYLIKPAREGFLAASPIANLSETEIKAYSSFGQSLLLLAVIPLYDWLAARLSRRSLITWIPAFFATNLLVFWALQPGLLIGDASIPGIAFYLWVGIFNVFIIAQFWSFATDVYDDERGRRLVPMIAIGATAGAAGGAWASERIVESAVFGSYSLLLFAAALLMVTVALLRSVEKRGFDREPRPGETKSDPAGGFRLILQHRYLLATAALILMVNWVNTNGENLLFGAVAEHVEAEAKALGLVNAEAADKFVREQTTAFYGDFFFWVNLTALLLQAFVASRLLRYGGFGPTLLLLPVIALLAYSTMAVFPILSVIRLMKVAENSTDYSIHNTAKQVLWLPTTSEMKYKAKAAIDTLFVRTGDGLAALTAFVGITWLDLPLRYLFAFNALLVVVWLGFGWIVVGEQRRWQMKRERRKSGERETA